MPAPDPRPNGARPAHPALRVAVAGSAVLAVAAGVVFYYATTLNQRDTPTDSDYDVTVMARACAPNEITVPGGRRRFRIINASDRPIEWEILDGVMVVAERENIPPGFEQSLTVNLMPGDYEMTCGLLSNPRGVLHVTDSEEARMAAATVTLRHFLGPLAEYKVYLVQQSMMAVDAAGKLAEAIRTGDLDAARTLWTEARRPYKRIEPLAYRFSDLENAIDPSADYLRDRERDAAFTGFHRLEYGLFAQGATDGLAPVADRLVSDLTALQERLLQLKLTPALLLAAPGDMADLLAQGKIVDGEDHYAHKDLADIAANLEGIAKIADLLRGIVRPVDPALDAEIGGKLEAVSSTLAAMKTGDGFPPYDHVDAAARQALARTFEDLAQVLARLPNVIGVS